ncbi:Surfactin synthase thioesterase subunit [Paenibacillus sophorae]|uniref:Surfactin synthase thioesterase subunit n=1 Tax=Paenibacillus sophorae TaxID=1333845 RepID=A0A1H8SZ23_9BACL|nr:thioesterase domain-containing protein [Paenibacillus sophorae]QWU15605.1 thioesterase II family protein [Paenibacillus sophorae]SEO83598.1 Surfactin synthase thioesterase subunit [Paenibacillus sophorae]
MHNMKVFCLPYAGGSTSMYMKWKPSIHPMIEWVPLELAGRGIRLYEPHCETFDECLEDVYEQIVRHRIDMPYALFGHSMGASIAFEATRKLIEEGHSVPKHLFLSGRRSPQSARPIKQMHLLSEAEFIEELRLLGGTAEEIFADRNLLEMFLPIIRADYRMLSTYSFRLPQQPLDIAFTVLNGKADDLYPQEIIGWQAFTSHKCEYLFFEGGHFFIEQHYKEIGAYVNSVMLPERIVKAT